MQFGLFYEIAVPKPWSARSEADAFQEVIAQAVLAERVGFHSLWTVEHHFLSEFSHCSAPEVLYGAIAARTSRIRIGHGVRLLPFPYNHPIRAAEMAATLDLVCDGRLEFGTGRSATRDELEGFGIDPQETRRLWEEALDVVVGAWTQDVFSWHGEFFEIPPRRVLPKPLQQPHPPLWMASTSARSHELAGLKGLGLLSFTIGVPPEELAARLQLYRDALRSAKPVGKFVNDRAATFTLVYCDETTAAARATAAESCEWYVRRSVELLRSVATWQRERDLGSYEYIKALEQIDVGTLTFDVLDAIDAVIVGDPERCVQKARRYQEAGCDLLLCFMQPYNIPAEKVRRSIELVGRYVRPAFKG
jgi:alkanesulfonate monooxygenase SsuD/methylene tetrahydromethanopterin reductase-like flavin-dependent oxidoreductase (luciferase family)